MSKLSASERAKLPDTAFAYIDSRGKRMLPIHDEPHVKNALARFDRVKFEDEAARDRARTRVLNAAKKHGIVPVGFITGQLRSEQKRVWPRDLPTGLVTIMLTDIESSTLLLRQLGDGYAALLDAVRETIREAVLGAGGREVEVRADEFFAVFDESGVGAAVAAAVAIQRSVGQRVWTDDLDVRVRIGLHRGDLTMTDGGYVGMAVHRAARICSAGHGGQIVVSDETRIAIEANAPAGIRLRSLGEHHLAGMNVAEVLYQVEADGLRAEFPPLRG
jgi:class 3 adenylate cyclase